MKPLREQTELPDDYISALDLHDKYTSLPKEQLALNNCGQGKWWTSYFIGVTEINGKTIEVLPKIENLDFMSLFSFALVYQPSSTYFSSCYNINWDKETLASAESYNVLTPLLVMRYLSVLEKLVGRGLKRDYMTIEENLHAKIKGRIRPIENWRKNVIKKKEDCFYCQYQIFTPDIPINRLLKKALDVSLHLLGNVRARANNMTGLSFLSSKIKLVDAFRNIDNNIKQESVKNFKFDKLNIYYPEAISLAKSILRHQDNSLTEESGKKRVPLFWIDMSRLYEVYVLGILRTLCPRQILFQVKGSYGTQCDYLHIGEGIILDAKYKPWYASFDGRHNNSDFLIADIREISGYARDEKLIKLFKKEVSLPVCIIIHPSDEMELMNSDILNAVKKNKIEGFKNFYRLGISLPKL